ncbi:casein kinase II, regulatory subunit [Mycena leptocephala]|nr:casein kinase II, regulatory subunit [Mycena leptocephala]
MQWISLFLSSKGNEYFCGVDEDFILDSFNLTGLDEEVVNYDQALDVLTDRVDDDMQDELRSCLDTHARLLYGLIHARWILTPRGMAKIVAKYECGDFGRCPRVFCHSQPLLPVGLVDVPLEETVKLYCGRCEDIYSPKSSHYNSIDGAYFGTTFPHLLCLVYPSLMPLGSVADTPATVGVSDAKLLGWEQRPQSTGMVRGERGSTIRSPLRYYPRVYGFRVNETAKLRRRQEAMHDTGEGGAVASSDDIFLSL